MYKIIFADRISYRFGVRIRVKIGWSSFHVKTPTKLPTYETLFN